jgi:hypothetical protein
MTQRSVRVLFVLLSVFALANSVSAKTLAVVCVAPPDNATYTYYVDTRKSTVTTSANTLGRRLLSFPAEITDRTIRWNAFGQVNTIDRFSGTLSHLDGGGFLATQHCRVSQQRTIE